MASIGDWLHLYQLQDDRGFQKKRHYTHTKTRPKVCVASRADIPELIRFVLANLETPPQEQVRWGASGADAAEALEDALGQMGRSLTADGHMVRGAAASAWLRRNIE
jgi:hypothetical protein